MKSLLLKIVFLIFIVFNANNSYAEDKNISVYSLITNMPLVSPLEKVHLTSDYGLRTHPITGSVKHHDGIDMRAKVGTPIYAPGSGVVSFVGENGNYGNIIKIYHGNNVETLYAHLSKYEVKVNDIVKRGQLIGYTGNTGRTNGPHLHYEIMYKKHKVDPLSFIEKTAIYIKSVIIAKK